MVVGLTVNRAITVFGSLHMSISIIVLVCIAFSVLLTFWPNFLIKLSAYLVLLLMGVAIASPLVVVFGALAIYIHTIGATGWVASVLVGGLLVALVRELLRREEASAVASIRRLFSRQSAEATSS